MHFLPSEVHRLVLGFLIEEAKCERTVDTFLEESSCLAEVAPIVRRGHQHATVRVGGKSLSCIFDEYSAICEEVNKLFKMLKEARVAETVDLHYTDSTNRKLKSIGQCLARMTKSNASFRQDAVLFTAPSPVEQHHQDLADDHISQLGVARAAKSNRKQFKISEQSVRTKKLVSLQKKQMDERAATAERIRHEFDPASITPSKVVTMSSGNATPAKKVSPPKNESKKPPVDDVKDVGRGEDYAANTSPSTPSKSRKSALKAKIPVKKQGPFPSPIKSRDEGSEDQVDKVKKKIGVFTMTSNEDELNAAIGEPLANLLSASSDVLNSSAEVDTIVNTLLLNDDFTSTFLNLVDEVETTCLGGPEGSNVSRDEAPKEVERDEATSSQITTPLSTDDNNEPIGTPKKEQTQQSMRPSNLSTAVPASELRRASSQESTFIIGDPSRMTSVKPQLVSPDKAKSCDIGPRSLAMKGNKSESLMAELPVEESVSATTDPTSQMSLSKPSPGPNHGSALTATQVQLPLYPIPLEELQLDPRDAVKLIDPLGSKAVQSHESADNLITIAEDQRLRGAATEGKDFCNDAPICTPSARTASSPEKSVDVEILSASSPRQQALSTRCSPRISLMSHEQLKEEETTPESKVVRKRKAADFSHVSQALEFVKQPRTPVAQATDRAPRARTRQAVKRLVAQRLKSQINNFRVCMASLISREVLEGVKCEPLSFQQGRPDDKPITRFVAAAKAVSTVYQQPSMTFVLVDENGEPLEVESLIQKGVLCQTIEGLQVVNLDPSCNVLVRLEDPTAVNQNAVEPSSVAAPGPENATITNVSEAVPISQFSLGTSTDAVVGHCDEKAPAKSPTKKPIFCAITPSKPSTYILATPSKRESPLMVTGATPRHGAKTPRSLVTPVLVHHVREMKTPSKIDGDAGAQYFTPTNRMEASVEKDKGVEPSQDTPGLKFLREECERLAHSEDSMSPSIFRKRKQGSRPAGNARKNIGGMLDPAVQLNESPKSSLEKTPLKAVIVSPGRPCYPLGEVVTTPLKVVAEHDRIVLGPLPKTQCLTRLEQIVSPPRNSPPKDPSPVVFKTPVKTCKRAVLIRVAERSPLQNSMQSHWEAMHDINNFDNYRMTSDVSTFGQVCKRPNQNVADTEEPAVKKVCTLLSPAVKTDLLFPTDDPTTRSAPPILKLHSPLKKASLEETSRSSRKSSSSGKAATEDSNKKVSASAQRRKATEPASLSERTRPKVPLVSPKRRQKSHSDKSRVSQKLDVNMELMPQLNACVHMKTSLPTDTRTSSDQDSAKRVEMASLERESDICSALGLVRKTYGECSEESERKAMSSEAGHAPAKSDPSKLQVVKSGLIYREVDAGIEWSRVPRANDASATILLSHVDTVQFMSIPPLTEGCPSKRSFDADIRVKRIASIEKLPRSNSR